MRDAAPPSDVAPPSDPPTEEPSILIAVIRTGGVAGMRRRWHVAPPPDEEPRWIELIDRCPWEEPGDSEHPAQRGADRYIWSIQARMPRGRLERDLPESALDGPWRQLVDAVRAAAAAS